MKLCALVINERDSFCDFLAGLLASEGHASLCAKGFREALRAAVVIKPDLIIVEISQADIGALEIVQKLQMASETRSIPIIVIADHAELEYEFLNVFDFLVRPVDVARLREDLAMLVAGRRSRGQLNKSEPLGGDDYQLFHDYLISHSGLHFERRNLKILERGLAVRMEALQINSCSAYFAYLTRHHHDRQELQKLLPFLTVGETYFFRYHAHFEALKKFITTEMADSPRKRIRLWSAGCSTGEEAYSMAMTVMDAIPDWRKRDIRIIATDIDNRALRKARDGVYGSWAMRVIEERYLDRYFDKVGKSFLIKKEVKELVDFSHLNLQTDQFPHAAGGLRDLDVIFCRNVMIYFSLATTRGIVDKIADSLAPEGLLFLGHAETLAQISSRFERHAHNGSFYYRERKLRGATPQARPATAPRPVGATSFGKHRDTTFPTCPAVPTASQGGSAGHAASRLFLEGRLLFEAEQFEKAAELLAEVLRQQPGHTDALIIQGFILANRGRFEEALDHCRRVLAVDDLLPEAYFLRGLVLDMIDRPGEAVEEYRKAILLRMEFVMSHYYLGRLYFRLGRTLDGTRELRNTLKILEGGVKESIIPFSGGLSREVLLQQLRSETAMVM